MQPTLRQGCSVRIAQDTDVSEIASLLSTSFSLEYPSVYQSLCCRLLLRDIFSLIAVSNEQIQGILEVGIVSSNICYLFNLATDSYFRNQGIASKLLAEAEDIARLLEMNELYLHVLPENEKALRLYLRSGYEFCGVQFINQLNCFLLHKLLVF